MTNTDMIALMQKAPEGTEVQFFDHEGNNLMFSALELQMSVGDGEICTDSIDITFEKPEEDE